MNLPPHPSHTFEDVLPRIASNLAWHYDATTSRSQIKDIPAAVRYALRTPADYPPLSAAIAPGDRVALAVDPNLPDLVEVIRGVLLEIEQADADAVDIVLWDEATDATLEWLTAEFENLATISRHDSENRESLRYLGVDDQAEPVYLSRLLVDADLVLPLIAARPWDAVDGRELSGVYPMLADSNTRIRHHLSAPSSRKTKRPGNESQIGWMLGVQLILAVAANEQGCAGAIFSGTPDAIRRSYDQPRRSDDEFPPAAPLVIASIEGSAQQHTWLNLARAIGAAATHTEPGGTVLVWTQISEPPSDRLVHRSNGGSDDSSVGGDEKESGDGFTLWDDSIEIAETIQRVGSEYRLLLHSQVAAEIVESLGIGAVDSIDGVEHVSRSFAACGTLRSAQFAGGTFDSNLRYQHSTSSQERSR
ncbi:lactate racemase domain-containing protein [Novipirellula artificiosorum]|uniref:LarA-like N-terminal domain-containing protein n=1 Tax=Novipirellula artificiosorum TaxID=2528016 RepID=A0A5C6E2X3_9BACT|nr:lactate racemase domain-containing protein [Novipirellula artificiosorum]TWU41736.1 hypothetical protein Poly41_00280 [Novipirellula artificiosorum]